jgi:hypothetical protein
VPLSSPSFDDLSPKIEGTTMADKKKPTKATKDLPKGKLTAAQLKAVKGGARRLGAESCKETGDSGMMGCGTG